MGKLKKRKKFFRRNKILILIIIGLASYLSITLIQQQIRLRELRAEEQRVIAKIDELKAQKEELKMKIQESDDPDFIEKIAREKLKMVKPNEIIYIIQDDEDKEDEEENNEEEAKE